MFDKSSLRSSLWKFKIIYVYKISRSSDFFPLDHPVTKIYSRNGTGNGNEIKYFPSGERGKFFLDLEQGPEKSSTKNLREVIETIFRNLMFQEIFIESEKNLSPPWCLLPDFTREFPDFYQTISSRSEVIIEPSDFPSAHIPWKYKLPEEDDFIEMDAIGVLGNNILEKLDLYLKEVQKK